jgi:glycine cleavage system H protein
VGQKSLKGSIKSIKLYINQLSKRLIRWHKNKKMEGFSYNNIFETKGIEYLAIITFFAILIPFWLLLNKQVKNKKQIQKSLGSLSLNSLQIPQGLFFSRFHTWTYLERSGVAKVGLDDLLVHITGEVKLSRILDSGERIKKGDFLGEIVQNDKRLKIYSPISGEIVESNSLLDKNPELMNEDPYQKGWMYKIKPFSWVADTQSYFLAEDASLWAKQELERFKDFLAESIGKYSPDPSSVILQDGGELRDQPLSDFSNEIWQDFQQEFMSKKVLCRRKNCFYDPEEPKKD